MIVKENNAGQTWFLFVGCWLDGGRSKF